MLECLAIQSDAQANAAAKAPEAPTPQVMRVTHAPMNYAVVEQVTRASQNGLPYAVVILEIQPGMEAMAEQIVGALYHSDLHVQIMLLTAPGAMPMRRLMETVGQSPRMATLNLPCDEAELAQWIRVLASKWAGEKAAARMPEAPHAVVLPEPTTKSSPPAADKANAVTLEAMGSLATGIAHEFNNVLTVIQNQMDMAMRQAGGLPEVVTLLGQMMHSARDASALTRKLVAHAPEAPGQPGPAQITTLVDEEVALLKKTLGEQITLMVEHAPDLPPVWVDPMVVSQVLVNTAVHARAAMPQGGTLQFSTRPVQVETGGKYARLFKEARQGEYVMLTVEDPNPAEPPQAVPAVPPADERLTWLRRTLEMHGGAFNATLIPGMVRVYQMLFPLAIERPELMNTAPPEEDMTDDDTTPATILVVDDDEAICMIMSQVLTMQKHRVLTAHNADEGWQRWCQNRHTIKLLVTDINMPGGANGVALGQAIKEDDRTVPVVYTSGHRAAYQYTDLSVGQNYLPKPFGMSDLLKVVDQNLAASRRQRRALPAPQA